jgi:GT2 family glycosyltransferase
MDLSVIIVSYNVRYFLEQCLVTVRKASEHIDCEIFVVDNNSADGSCSMVSREFPEVKLVMNNENRGFSAANNQAIKLATGRYILLLNPDTLIGEDTFNKCISFMDGHPEAGATGVRMINGKGKLLPESKRALPTPKTAFFKITGLSYIFPKSGLFSKYYLADLDSMKTTQVDIISGAFMFLRSEVVPGTGLFDESFFMYGEDIDYSYRLLKQGFKNYYYPEVMIIHYKGESTKKESPDVLVNFYKAMIIFVRKHFNNGNLKALILPIHVAIFFRAGLSLFKQFFKRLFLPVSGSLFAGEGKTVIISDAGRYQRVKELMASAGIRCRILGRVTIDRNDLDEEVLGSIDQIREVVRAGRIKQIVFSAGQLSTNQIIESLHLVSDMNISMKLASEGEKYITGSGFAYCREI